MLKALSASLIVLGMSTVYAGSATVNNHGGFYVGLEGAYQMTGFHNRVTLKSSPYTVTKGTDNDRGITPGFLFGYDYLYRALDLAAQINVTYDNAQHTHYGTTHNSTKKFYWNTGLEILPGWRINDHFTPFAILGLERGFFRHSTYNNTTAVEAGHDFNRWGGELGLGLKYYFNMHWSSSLGYSYTWYQTEKTGSDPNAEVWKSTMPRIQRIFLNIAYHF